MSHIGKLIIVVAPSGSGKGTLIDHIKKTFGDEIKYPVSCTTRVMRPEEIDGNVYHFISREEFKKRIDRHYFLEWAEYSGNLYGTPKKDILDHIAQGDMVLREVEIQGAQAIKKTMNASELVIIYVDAGSWKDLEKRIESRAPLSEKELELRHRRFLKEIEFKVSADYVVSNKDGEIDEAKKNIIEIIRQLQN